MILITKRGIMAVISSPHSSVVMAYIARWHVSPHHSGSRADDTAFQAVGTFFYRL